MFLTRLFWNTCPYQEDDDQDDDDDDDDDSDDDMDTDPLIAELDNDNGEDEEDEDGNNELSLSDDEVSRLLEGDGEEEEDDDDDGDAAKPSGDEEDTKLTDKLGELSLNEAFLASEDSDLELGCRDGDMSAETGNVAFCPGHFFRPTKFSLSPLLLCGA